MELQDCKNMKTEKDVVLMKKSSLAVSEVPFSSL